jgi:glycosyltransferase involved in cell wall biosynthesis
MRLPRDVKWPAVQRARRAGLNPPQPDRGERNTGGDTRLRVLVLSSLSQSLLNFRGRLLSAMVAEGHDVVACAPDRDEQVVRRLQSMGVRFTATPMARASSSVIDDIRTLAYYVAIILRERPSIVLAYTQKPIIFGGIATRLVGGCNFFALVSGLGYVFSPAADDRRILRGLVCRLYSAALKRACAIFVFNSADRHDMMRLGIVSERQKVIQVPGSGVDLGYFTPSPQHDGRPTFLMVARLMRDKGVAEFIAAARDVRATNPDARFMLLGRCEDENPTGIRPDELKAMLEGSCVELFDETNDVRPYLNACTAFVLPSFYREGLPRTILEAMASARAVITTDLPGCRDAVRDGVNGLLVPPQDANALAEAMRRLANDPTTSAAMGTRGRVIAEQEYDVRRVNGLLLREMHLDCRHMAEDPVHRGGPAAGVASV